jgi:hypothetical protein
VPIASLKPGDKILATNTKTGKTSAAATKRVRTRQAEHISQQTAVSYGRCGECPF